MNLCQGETERAGFLFDVLNASKAENVKLQTIQRLMEEGWS